MSSVPPYNPPGGGAPPPYDPKAQYRAFREQQKAAWRAQREAWRAQRHAYRAGGAPGMPFVPSVPSVVGPLLLIGVGVISLLLVTGHMDAGRFWDWYGRWWPLLLIGAGLALLAEWAIDAKRQVAVRRGGGFVGVLIVLAVIGVVTSGMHHNWDRWHNEWGGNDEFWNMFGRPQHDMDQQVLNAPLPANGTVNIDNPRGDVNVTSGDGTQVVVEAHQIAYANND